MVCVQRWLGLMVAIVAAVEQSKKWELAAAASELVGAKVN
jgi:hypothetical protein